MSIAQLNRAAGCGPAGRGFESLWAHHLKIFMAFFRFFMILMIFSAQNLSADPKKKNKKSAFQIYGDIFQHLPIFAGTYALLSRDFYGARDLFFAATATALTTFASKQIFVKISEHNQDLAEISRRPDSSEFNGFPSGHTSFAFSGAGFLQKRYGVKFGAPALFLAALVGASRIYARRHTSTQVFFGAALGFSAGFFMTKNLFFSQKDNEFALAFRVKF